MTKNADGTSKLIGPSEKWLFPTDNCFWKDPEDIKSSVVKKYNQTINQTAVSNKDYNHNFENERIRQWIFCTDTCTMKESDRFYVV